MCNVYVCTSRHISDAVKLLHVQHMQTSTVHWHSDLSSSVVILILIPMWCFCINLCLFTTCSSGSGWHNRWGGIRGLSWHVCGARDCAVRVSWGVDLCISYYMDTYLFARACVYVHARMCAYVWVGMCAVSENDVCVPQLRAAYCSFVCSLVLCL